MGIKCLTLLLKGLLVSVVSFTLVSALLTVVINPIFIAYDSTVQPSDY